MSPRVISQGSRVVMHFDLRLEDGTEVLASEKEAPLEFTLGDGTLESALESKLLGLKAGDEQALILSGSDLFGERDPDNQQWLDITLFTQSEDLAEGQVIAFTTPGGEETAGTVSAIAPESVLIDFNHPLSGRTVIFTTNILEIDNPE